MIITYDALDLIKQEHPPPGPIRHQTSLLRDPPDMFKLAHFEAVTAAKRTVHILLECFLVSDEYIFIR